ncbi:hypothetical protein E0485_22080 [Paenibacillus albiflavus]|uniref:Uncharacterized protein n=1 Tax=Paenibacillus albiflavus TaxID=2545760 RepID=A0A4R4E5E6_9BACL|nr:hypothetical protein [Paenibacillus albiflavus]TCZ72855.1 hypothetical protein E0485_22080 [Paenibacillus albiflavus]
MDKPEVTGQQLADQWARELPAHMPTSDHAKVWSDESNDQALRIHITNAGRSSYTFDFACTYMDSREVKVDLVDVEKDDLHIDETQDQVQGLIEDYVRHIHECAQALHDVTHHGEGVQ